MATLFRTLLAAAALLAGSVTPAQACIYNLTDKGSPIPPCKVEDIPGAQRMRQLNSRLSAKLAVVAQQVRFAQQEIAAWQSTYETTRNYVDEMQQIWGDLTADPLPSLVSTYNRHSPLNRYVTLTPGGKPEMVDLRAAGDSVLAAIETSALAFYEESRDRAESSVMRYENRLESTAAHIERELGAMADYRQYATVIQDSLQAVGDRLASRYEGVSSSAGLSEAKISELTALFAQLRGTAFELEGASVAARLQALEGARDAAVRAADASTAMANVMGGI